MARLLGLLFCLGMFLTAQPALATEALEVPPGLTDFGQSEANIQVSKTSPDFTTITLDQPAVAVTEQMIDFDTYHSFTVPGEPWEWQEGCPAIPQVTRFYRIPNTGSVDLIVTEQEYDLIEGVNPLPVQEEIPSFGQLVRNGEVYTRDAWYPPHVAEVSSPAVMRDFRVVTVTLHPVQVNPVTHQARIYRRLSANLVANDRPGENELLNPGRPSGAWAEIYRSHIANLDERALDEMTTTPGTYLILTKNTVNAQPWADSLFIWKTRKGFKVVVDSRASWTAATMITAIRSLYSSAATTDTPLEHVCLVGDPNYGGGADGVPTDGTGSSGNYDHSFACATATDNVEDISVGRLCGETLTHMATINAKIMQYEREPWIQDTLWYHKGFFYGGVSNSVASNYLAMQWASQMFRLYTGVTNNTVLYHTGTAVDNSTVITQINGGVAVFLWRGGWIGGMSSSLAGSTNPNHRLPITLTITCSTGDFEATSDVSESWLTAGTPTDPKGGVCGIGTATAGTHPPQNYTLAGGLVYNICNLNVEHIGTCLVGSKLWLHRAFGFNSTFARNFSSYCNLMGDPGLSIWTDVPKVMSVTHPSTLNVGARQVAVRVTRASDSVAVDSALVVLWKRGTDSTWVKGLTDLQGRITLPVRVNQTGEMMLTITKRNHKPYLATLPCLQADQMCMVSSYTLDDDNSGGTIGNSDGVANPGETIDIATYVKNFGATAPANSVSALLSTSSPRITVLQASATYPTLAAGDSAVGSVPFRVRIAPDMQNRETALLTLTITTTLGQTVGAIELRCVAGAAEFRSYQLPDGALNPGTTRALRVTLRNSGSMLMSGVSARLVSLSPFVQVSDANAVYGDLAVGSDVTNSTDGFVVTASTLAFRGHQASMLIITTATGGHLDSASFVLPVGTALTTDPTGPDTYGYCAYDNTDVDYEMHPTYQYVNISQTGVGTNLNLSDTGEQVSVSPVWSTARALPFPFKFYGQVYDSVTICANGWIAFGNQSWNPAFRNYPIPAMVAPEAMIAPYWDDLRTSNTGQGVWMHYDADSHCVVFQWKGSAGTSYGTSLDFEVILFDTTFHPTFDGNGLILMQYNTVSMNLASGDNSTYEAPGSSIGIQAPRGVVGLGYVYQNSYAPGAATVVNGRAILFTTNTRRLFGNIAGTVTDAQTGLPMADVIVTVNGLNKHDVSDDQGHYFIADVLWGTHAVTATKRRFNTATAESVVVELDSTVVVDFTLYHPEMALSSEQMLATIGNQPLDTSFSIINAGNGPLDYAISVFYAGDENPNPWDSVAGISVSAATGDLQIMGCEFVDNEWWVTGGGGPGGQNLFYRFNRNGQFLGSVPQPSTTAVGWFDLACDSQYIYGSEDNQLVGINRQGMVQTLIPTPVNPARAVAYDPATDHFWVSDYTQDFYEINRQGNIVRQIPNEGSGELSITGLAWNPADPDGFKLYVFSQNGASRLTRVTRLHPASQTQEFVVDLPGRAGDRAGGCAITPRFNSTLVVFGGIFQNTGGDRLQVHEMTFNTTWIEITPALYEVPASSATEVGLHFDPLTLLPDVYRVNLHIRSEVLDTLVILPVVLTVTSSVAPEPLPLGVPAVFALRQNYPNPFNPVTTIGYDLPRDGHACLAVYNLLGERVAELVNERQPAGSYAVRFDAADLPSGMYFYRFESGSFVQSAKMILMK